MFKVKQMILLLSMIIPATFCNAENLFKIEFGKDDGPKKIVILKSQHGGTDKSGCIEAYCDCHYLTVAFLENLGQVSVEITTSIGNPVEFMSMTTPNGYQYYIVNTGDYIVTFTLSNGDVYYGQFTVTD